MTAGLSSYVEIYGLVYVH